MCRAGLLALACVIGAAHAAPAEAQPTERALGLTRPVDSLATASGVGQSGRQHLTRSSSRVRIVVSLTERVLSVLEGRDTVARMPVGVGTGRTFAYDARAWTFRTPRGEWRVVRRLIAPVWTPPDWHYAETARYHGLRLARLHAGGTTLSTGARLVIRENVVGIVFPGADFAELPVDEHIVFDGRLFIPPVGTANRRVSGDLGRYALDLGHGYLIHGTTDEASVGRASTHGCIRVHDDDLVWLFEHIGIGTRVTIH